MKMNLSECRICKQTLKGVLQHEKQIWKTKLVWHSYNELQRSMFVTFQSQVVGWWETYHSDPAPSGYEAVQSQAVTCEQIYNTLVYDPWYEGCDQISQLSG
jgi:hypothetical protein